MSGIQQALPPGFRFHPTDQELILHYLKNKVTACPLPACIVSEVDLYQHNPWDLPGKALFGEDEWYFFTPRDRKYPNGARPNRAAASGYWKATGIDRPIFTSCGTKSIGVKKALVFYNGCPPKGIKTDWIMHEYRLLDTMITWRRKGSMRLDDWVLCRVRQKNTVTRNISEDLTHMSESSYFQKATGLQSPVTEPNAQLIKKSVNYPLLPYLLDTPNFSHFKRISSTCSRKYLLDEEEKQMFASSSQSMFDLSTGYSDEPSDLKSTRVGSSITSLHHCNSMSSLLNSDVSEDRSDPEKIHSSEDRCQGEMYEQLMPSSTTSDAVNLLDIEQTQIFQNLIADQWTSIFQD